MRQYWHDKLYTEMNFWHSLAFKCHLYQQHLCLWLICELRVDALYRRVERNYWSRRDPMQTDAQWQLRKGHG